MYAGKGNFSHEDIYSLPISIRNLYFDRLNSRLADEEQKMQKAKRRGHK